MKKERKYYALNSKELANALAYIGFQYMKFDDYKYGKVYSFENTKELHDANMVRCIVLKIPKNYMMPLRN